MARALRLEGPCAPLFFLAAALLLLSARIAGAQTVDMSSLELCAKLETAELKLACFEAIAAAGQSSEVQVPEIAKEEKPEETPDAATEPGSDSFADEMTPDAVQTEVNDALEDSTPVSETPAVEDFGSEQLAAPNLEDKKEVIKAKVVNVTTGHNKVLYFHLANGHVWRQIEPRRLQYPKSGHFDVNITQGVMGEYRLRIGDNGRMVRIRRVK